MPGRTAAALALLLAAAGCAGARMEGLGDDAEALSCRPVLTPEGAPSAAVVTWRRAVEDVEELAEWCASVGPVVVSADPLAAGGSARAAGTVPQPQSGDADAVRREVPVLDSVPVVTWNVHVGGGEVERLVGELRGGRITGRPERHFVLLLQEVHRADSARVPARLPDWNSIPARITESPPGDAERIDVGQAARRLGLSLFYAPSMRNGPPVPGLSEEDRGNAILSTLALEELEAAELPFEAQRRVAVTATVRGRTSRGEPWSLRATSAHLDVRSRWARFWESLGGARLRQARGLVGALEDDTARVQVVGGDFNTIFGTREDAVLEMRRRFPQSPPPVREPTFVQFGSRLDYFFLRSPHARVRPRARRLREPYNSDHYPLLMWVRVAPER